METGPTLSRKQGLSVRCTVWPSLLRCSDYRHHPWGHSSSVLLEPSRAEGQEGSLMGLVGLGCLGVTPVAAAGGGLVTLVIMG